MEERRRAEAHVHLMRDELVQSNKLATLGQIAAGVAHEINQPVAAIRAYADNASIFLDRADPDTARSNLA
jgi:two-component system C4-dicarboxylate transport sensor histidine kinase DctB